MTNWNELELDTSLNHLEFSKKLAKKAEKEWRPTNKKVEEQVNPAVLKMLEKRKSFLEHQTEFQNQNIEQLVPMLEERRLIIKNQAAERKKMLILIAADHEKMKTLRDQTAYINNKT